MRRVFGPLLVLLLGACSRSNFDAAENQFVDSLNYLELIHTLLAGVQSERTLREAERKVPILIDDFERLRGSTEPISLQLANRLREKYRDRREAAWKGIVGQLQRLRGEFDSPMILKLEAWLAMMMQNE